MGFTQSVADTAREVLLIAEIIWEIVENKMENLWEGELYEFSVTATAAKRRARKLLEETL